MAGNMSSSALLEYSLHYQQWFSDSDVSGVSSPETLSPDSSPSPLLPKAGKPGCTSRLDVTLQGRPRRAVRVRSKQRESASEKEKLRMRDLTKALHHLRSYLPPSVAPSGQTLTKIETLRLAIRYISFLSAQLGDTSSSSSSSSSSYYCASPQQAPQTCAKACDFMIPACSHLMAGAGPFPTGPRQPRCEALSHGGLGGPLKVQARTSRHIYRASFRRLCSQFPRLLLPAADHCFTSRTTDMETQFHLHETQGTFSLECLMEKSCLVYDVPSDPGYFSAGLSPTSSEDSFSPNLPDASDWFLLSSPSPAPVKKSRSRYPGKKRQTASEREKLRMRDLTKALHHLRSYLPPSVAPPGQTLTKIETLRLAVRYISFLSAQLGLSEEALEQMRRPPGQAAPPQTLSQFLGGQDGFCEQSSAVHMLAPQTGCQVSSPSQSTRQGI
ncbi:uncharacterized protein LOC133497497 [Syngnathoides biaculeatus]|uniref:uncharacterized protein LOC133497497 n=1 Tax=Syngnathoides biaculeatus TaxID=300417 RepID=UPI002ADD98EC|nr:uncharacterized protein LOC133497497 [Syngnathoides biaculeatus]